MDRNVIYYKEIDSTNRKAKELAETKSEGLVVIADRQTAGRGRRGRSWESSAEDNLYMSLLLKPQIPVTHASMLTLVMACSVADAFAKCGIRAQIKWPNDLILGDKKICGILTEMEVTDEQIDFVVIGVGVNLNQSMIAEELKDKATSVFLETGKRIEREELVTAILDCFEENYACFQKEQNLNFLQEEYNEMLVNKNRQVLVLEPAGEYQGIAMGINEKGELLVQKEDGQLEPVFAGEVSVRGIYGYV